MMMACSCAGNRQQGWCEGSERSVVDELPVDLVADEEQAMSFADLSDLDEILVGQHHARGVPGCRKYQGTRLACDGLLDLGRMDPVVVVGMGGHGGRLDAQHVSVAVVVGVVGLADEDLVTGVGHRGHREESASDPPTVTTMSSAVMGGWSPMTRL